MTGPDRRYRVRGVGYLFEYRYSIADLRPLGFKTQFINDQRATFGSQCSVSFSESGSLKRANLRL